MATPPDPLEHRKADHPIEGLFVKRWSPRAMSGAAVSREDMNRLLEAARWAPSTFNTQEWRFLYAFRDTDHWPTFMAGLVEFNQQWCADAGALIVVLSHKVFPHNGKPNPVHTFDAGLAAENLALQGAAMGLVVHGMAGIEHDKIRSSLQVPNDYEIHAMYAVGHPGDPDKLPEGMAEKERVSGRKPIAAISAEGEFNFPT